MKNASALVLLFALIVLMAAVFIVTQQRTLSTFPASKSAVTSVATSEDLRKTQVALQELEGIRSLLSGGASEKPGALLAVSVPASPQSAARQETPPGRPPDSIVEKATWHAGYSIPVTATASVVEKKPAPPATAASAPPKAVIPDYRVSFIYVSQDIKRAVIDDVFVHEGEMLADGTHVLSIKGHQLTLEKNGKRKILTVPRIYTALSAPPTP